MSTSHDPNSYDPGQPPPSEKPPTEQGNVLWYCLGGCALMAVLALIGASVLGYLVYTKGRQFGIDVARRGMVQIVQESELADDDKQEIIGQIDRVANAYQEGEITTEQLGRIAEELSESPLLVVGLVYFIEQKYINGSGLSDEEKAEARLTLQRAARGAYEETIPQSDLEQAAAPLMTTGPNGEQQLKEQVTDEELRELLADLKKLADTHQIPEEPFKVDIGAEFRKAVDKVIEE